MFEFLQEFCQLSLLATIKDLHQALNIFNMIWKSFFDLFTTGIGNRYNICTAVFWIGFACNPTIADHITNNHSHISRGRKNAINQILNAEIALAVQGLKNRELSWCQLVLFKDMSLRRTDQSFCLVEDDHGF